MGVPTSSRRYLWRRHLDSKMAAPEMTSTKTWGGLFDPFCGGGGKWRAFRLRPPSSMATGSGRAAIFRRRRNRDRKGRPILLLRVTGFVRGIHWWPVNSPHKWPDDCIIKYYRSFYGNRWLQYIVWECFAFVYYANFHIIEKWIPRNYVQCHKDSCSLH